MAVEADIQDGAAPAGGNRKKLIILVAAAAVVVLGAGGGLYVFLSASQAAPEAAHAEAGTVAPVKTFIFNLPQMIVNLNTADGEPESFLRMTIALEVADEHMMSEIQPDLAKVVDAFQVYLRELRKSDLEGSAGVYRLKEELTRRINTVIYPARIEGILFRELLVQ